MVKKESLVMLHVYMKHHVLLNGCFLEVEEILF